MLRLSMLTFAAGGQVSLAACAGAPADVTRHKPPALAFPGPSDRPRSTFSEARLLHVTQLSLEVSRAICALVSRAKNSSMRSAAPDLAGCGCTRLQKK